MQFQYSHKPSIIFEFKKGVAKFIRAANDGTSSDSEALELLAANYNMRIVETDMYDDDNVGFERSTSQSLRFV